MIERATVIYLGGELHRTVVRVPVPLVPRITVPIWMVNAGQVASLEEDQPAHVWWDAPIQLETYELHRFMVHTEQLLGWAYVHESVEARRMHSMIYEMIEDGLHRQLQLDRPFRPGWDGLSGIAPPIEDHGQDEGPGMLLEELLGEIDAELADRKEADNG